MKTSLLTPTQKLSLAVLAATLLAVCPAPAVMVTWVGTNGLSATTNWSDVNNWDQINTTTHISPANNAANFTFQTMVANNSLITVNVDGAYQSPGTVPAQSYGAFFSQTNGYHHVFIQPGMVWAVQASAGTPGVGISVGPQPTNNNTIGTVNTVSNGITFTNYTIIEGLGGTLSNNGPGLRVDAGSTIVNNHYSILDMSGLGSYYQTNTTAAASDYFYLVDGAANSQGLIYLALTNVITLYDAVEIGYLGSSSNSLPIGVYLGQSNYITTGAGNNYFIVGYTGCTNAFLRFNPSVLGGPNKPTAYIAGTSGNQNVLIASATSGKVPGNAICDFTGGNVTWQANTMYLGVSGAAGVPANGVLTYDTGTVNVNTIAVGMQASSAGAPGVGAINVGPQATLQVNNYMILATNAGTVTAGTTGTVNINGGTLVASSVTNGGGAGALNLTNANWNVALTSTSVTNIKVNTFNAAGTTNIINITSVTPFLGNSPTVRFHLIASANLSGASTLGVTLPASYNPSYPYGGYLDTTSTPGLIDFVLTSAPPSAVVLTWTGTNGAGNPDGDWDVGATADWLAAGAPTTYAQFDVVTFNDVPPPAQTNINLTTTLTPYSLTVNNAASLYTIGGSGSISGVASLTKQGTNTLILDNSASNNFTGGVTISGGILQIGANDTGGTVPIGPVTDNSILAFDRTDTVIEGDVITGSGGVVVAGGGTLQLAAANTFAGPAVATNASILQGGVAGAFGSASGAVIIANGSTLDANGAGTSRGITVSGTGVGANGAIINSSATVIGDATGGLTPTLTLAGNTYLTYQNRWDLGSSTGATLSTSSNAYNLTLDGTANGTYFEWRDVRADSQLANINVVAGQFGVAGSTTLGNPTNTLSIASGAYLKFYNDDGFNVSINKQVVLNDGGYLQNAEGASTMAGGLIVTNSSGGPGYCNFIIGGTSLTVTGPVSGNGILYMTTGTSSLLLNGNASAFTGGAQVFAGALSINNTFGSSVVTQPAAALAGVGTVTGLVDDRGPLYPGANGVAGTFNAAGGLTLENGAALTMDLTTTTTVGGGVNDLVNVTGNLTVNGNTIYINPVSGTLANGTYLLMTYTGSLIGSFTGAQTVSPSRYTLTLNTSTSGQILLTVVGNPNNLVWNNGSDDNSWDVESSYNWSNLTTHAEDQFYTSDSVTFNDTISLAANPGTNVNITSVTYPSTVTINASANNYAFSGPGSIAGGASLLKEGSSPLVIDTTNSFAGAVTIAGGIVQAGNVSSLGAATGIVTITNGGTLDLDGSDISAKSYFVSGAGAGGMGAIMNSGAAIFDSGNGSLTNITLLGDATFGGNGRWDFGNRATGATLSTGGNPYNLTFANASVNTYTWEWYNVAADPALNNINLEAGEWGLAGTNLLGNPLGTITIYPTAQLIVYAGSNYTKNYHLMTNGEIQINAGGPVFNFSLTMDAGSIFSSASAAQITGPALLTGLAEFNITAGGCTFSNAISGSGGIEMIDADTSPLILAGTNAYTGSTVLNGGGSTLELLGAGSISSSANIVLDSGSILMANTRADGTLALASGQTLGGTGAIRGSLVGGAGSTIVPGLNGIGTLTVTNAVYLQGETAVGVGVGSNNLLTGKTINYGGTLNVSFVPGTLAAGNSFTLFNSTTASYSGNFTGLTPSTPGLGLIWDTSQLDVSGKLNVLTTPSPATFAYPVLSGTNLTLSGTGGTTNGTYQVLTSTNIALPLTNWIQIGSGAFDSNGNFNFPTPATNSGAQFYILKEP